MKIGLYRWLSVSADMEKVISFVHWSRFSEILSLVNKSGLMSSFTKPKFGCICKNEPLSIYVVLPFFIWNFKKYLLSQKLIRIKIYLFAILKIKVNNVAKSEIDFQAFLVSLYFLASGKNLWQRGDLHISSDYIAKGH